MEKKKRVITQYIAFFFIVFGVGASAGTFLLEKHLLAAHLGVHLQFQCWISVLLGFVLFCFIRNWKWVLFSSLYLAVSYAFILHPISLFSISEPEEFDIFYMNTHYSNTKPQNISKYLKEKAPDTVALTETNPKVVELVDVFRSDKIINHRAYASSCTIYGGAHESSDISNLTHLPICTVSFPSYDLLLVHAHRPFGDANLQENLDFFDVIKSRLVEYEQNGEKFVLVGDFNSSNYSKYFKDRFGEYIHVNRHTWLTHTPLTTPIDHVLTNMEVKVFSKRISGSDHSALLIDILE